MLDAMRADRPLSERIVWQCLENHANGHRFWAISIADLATELHLNRDTVIDAIKALERDGIIRARRHPRRTTTYFMQRVYGRDFRPEPPDLGRDFRPQTADLESEIPTVENPPSKNNPPSKHTPLPPQPDWRAVFDLPPKPTAPPCKQVASDADPDFAAFWAAYPRKDSKGHARRAWAKAVKIASVSEILAGLDRYRFDENPRYRPLPATWLNGERWLQADEADTFDPVLRAVGLKPEDFANTNPQAVWERLLQ
jgi:hypothetical protein